MRKKQKINATIVAGIIFISAFSLLLYAGITVPQNYLKDVRIPGIVEGSAKMVDTEKYFTRNILETATVEIDITCNNSDNLELSVGYKSPYVDLLDISKTKKEVKLWRGGELYPAKTIIDKAITTSKVEKTQITKWWDLLEADFTTEEYVKADERIWYLKIKDISGGPYGYEKNITEIVNGTTITYTEFIPNICFLNAFELSFNNMRFKTLLYPCFDGTAEIIVPIRGVNHELILEEETPTENSDSPSKGSFSTTTTNDWRPYNHWAVVFATAVYEDSSTENTNWAVYAGHLFMMGQAPNPPYTFMYDLPNGIFDYGWSIIYCLGKVSNSLYNVPTKTCDYTDDDFLDSMLTQADSKCGANDELIIFTHGHGKLVWLQHATCTYYTDGSSDVFTCSEYKDAVDDITSDSTYVFLWVACCQGDGLGSWLSSKHNYHLEVWYYTYVVKGMALIYSNYYYWYYGTNSNYGIEGYLFFNYASSTNPLYHVKWIGDAIEDEWEDHTGENMNTKDYYGTYHFFISY